VRERSCLVGCSVFRVYIVVMRCLNSVLTEMAAECRSSDAASQFKLDTINPLVQLTRPFVDVECGDFRE